MAIVTFEQAKKLKKLGFNLDCRDYYIFDKSNDIKYDRLIYGKDFKNWNLLDHLNLVVGYASAPCVSDALQWIRDNKGIVCAVEIDCTKSRFGVPLSYTYAGSFILDSKVYELDKWDDYGIAESALLDKLLNYLEEKED